MVQSTIIYEIVAKATFSNSFVESSLILASSAQKRRRRRRLEEGMSIWKKKEEGEGDNSNLWTMDVNIKAWTNDEQLMNEIDQLLENGLSRISCQNRIDGYLRVAIYDSSQLQPFGAIQILIGSNICFPFAYRSMLCTVQFKSIMPSMQRKKEKEKEKEGMKPPP